MPNMRYSDTRRVCPSSGSGVVVPAKVDRCPLSALAAADPAAVPAKFRKPLESAHQHLHCPRFSFTFSQAISRFFRLYTLSINEWTYLAPVGLIQSTSLLRRERTGFSLKEPFRPPSSLLIWFPFPSRPSSPAAFPDPLLVADHSVTQLSSHFRYCSALRPLTERHSPFRLRL